MCDASRMRTSLHIALAATAAVVLGLGSGAWAVRAGLSAGNVANGPWRTSLTTGSAEADLYTRARVAVGALLALSPAETIYWNADRDSSGALLEARCDYEVAGDELPARWWSITAYGSDDFLIPNEPGRYSFSQTTLAREPRGAWAIEVSTEAKPRNWLPSGRSGDAGRFALTLRLYNPERAMREQPGSAELPQIERGECR